MLLALREKQMRATSPRVVSRAVLMANMASVLAIPRTRIRSCSAEVLGFLQEMSWQVCTIEVALADPTDGSSSFQQRWSVDGGKPADLASEIIDFIGKHPRADCATITCKGDD